MLGMIEVTITSYEALKAAVTTAYQAGEATINAKAALEAGRAALLLHGRIDGKNEAQREAQARQLLAPLFDEADAAESASRLARHTLELARLDVESVRAQLRLMEMAEASLAQAAA